MGVVRLETWYIKHNSRTGNTPEQNSEISCLSRFLRRVAGSNYGQVAAGQDSLLRSGGWEGTKEPDPDTPPLGRVTFAIL